MIGCGRRRWMRSGASSTRARARIRRGVRWVALSGSLLAIGLLGAKVGTAHVVMGIRGLPLRVADSDLIVRGEILDPARIFVLPDGRTRRRLVEARILETLKGQATRETIRLVQEGHEGPRYRKGEEVLLFLEDLARSRELAVLATPMPGGPTYQSTQESDEHFLLSPPGDTTEVLLSAVRDLIRSEQTIPGEARLGLVRRATLALLGSHDAQLGSSALASLVIAQESELIRMQDLPRIERILADPDVSMGVRAGLLAEIERRGLVESASHWQALFEAAPADALRVVIRAAGSHPGEAVDKRLKGLVAGAETEIAAEAAIALGRPGNVAAVGALAVALETGEARLRWAAIRGLTRIGEREALAVLERAATGHPDPGTQRRARAASRSIAAAQAAAGPPPSAE